MRLRIKSLLVALVVVVCGPAAPATAQEVSDGHAAAAMELLEVMRVDSLMQATAGIMVAIMVEQMQLQQFEGVFREFFKKYFTWEAVEGDYVRLYTDSYSESELRELIVFYRTPVGQKTIRITPELARRGAEIGQAVVERHAAELEAMIQAEAARNPG